MTTADPWGIDAAQAALDAAYEARDAVIIELVGDGLDYVNVGLTVGVSKQRVGQVMKTHRARLFVKPFTASMRLDESREAFRLAVIAQEQRCERYAMGYAAETAAFYGEPDAVQSDDAESRVRWAGFYYGPGREFADAS